MIQLNALRLRLGICTIVSRLRRKSHQVESTVSTAEYLYVLDGKGLHTCCQSHAIVM